MLQEFWFNFTHNLFKPLLLFFYMGFLIPILRVPFEFPKVLYQSLTIYLLVAIGWHGGEELANVNAATFKQAAGFAVIGLTMNFLIGIIAYNLLSRFTRLRKIDAATVAGYYGSDSAGTFVTCQGVLLATNLAFAAYMPVMLAVMEIPGCLVALYLVSRLRAAGMDHAGNMPDEENYHPYPALPDRPTGPDSVNGNGHGSENGSPAHDGNEHAGSSVAVKIKVAEPQAVALKAAPILVARTHSGFNPKVLHEVFLNPGLYLLFASIAIGFISGLQGPKVVEKGNELFLKMFDGVLCLFLLEMGMTACKRLRDLQTAGWRFIAFGLVAPNLFAVSGMLVAHLYSIVLGQPFEGGTYALFAVLCGAASYIAVPAVQRLAIPEASPTLPLAASLGLTFSYNVTVGIPLYIEVAKALIRNLPVT